MKKITAILLVILLLLSGCGGEQSGSTSTSDVSREIDQSEVDQSKADPSDVEEEIALPGSWTVPDGWVKAEKYSSEDKIFYMEEGHEDDELPDNISIEMGKNRYSTEEHEKFREAILRQFAMQLNGVDATFTGDGSFTEQEYILYTFTISEEDVVTTQFYIVGDQRYCLIHLTNFTGSDGAVEAAKAIVDSFVWSE